MNYEKGAVILKSKDLFESHSVFRYGWKKVRLSQFETVPHAVGKTIIGLLALKKKDGFLTEFKYPNTLKADVSQLKWKDKEIINYQIKHTHQDPEIDWKGVSNVFIDLNKAPEEVLDAFKILEKYFRQFII